MRWSSTTTIVLVQVSQCTKLLVYHLAITEFLGMPIVTRKLKNVYIYNIALAKVLTYECVCVRITSRRQSKAIDDRDDRDR